MNHYPLCDPLLSTFWFDLENAPDVLFFEPIAKRLREAGHTVHLTCRDYAGVPELARLYGIEGPVIGGFGGKRKLGKIAAGLWRAAALARWSLGKKIHLAVGFGSRPLAVACGLRRVRNATVFDYEHVSIGALNRFCDWIFTPVEVPLDYLTGRGADKRKIIQYRGLKEEVYCGVHQPDSRLLESLGFDTGKALVALRPPATLAHYHDSTGEEICRRVLERAAGNPAVTVILMTRDEDPAFDAFFQHKNIVRLERPVKGLDLIASSDLVISGGGTMVREAAALGTPACSIFTGRLGAVDERLSKEGRLLMIRRAEDAERIEFRKKGAERAQSSIGAEHPLDFFAAEFQRLARSSA